MEIRQVLRLAMALGTYHHYCQRAQERAHRQIWMLESQSQDKVMVFPGIGAVLSGKEICVNGETVYNILVILGDSSPANYYHELGEDIGHIAGLLREMEPAKTRLSVAREEQEGLLLTEGLLSEI